MANHFVEDMVNHNCQTLLAGMRNVFAFLRKFLLVSQKHFRGIHEILYELITYLHAQLATQAGQLYIEDNISETFQQQLAKFEQSYHESGGIRQSQHHFM